MILRGGQRWNGIGSRARQHSPALIDMAIFMPAMCACGQRLEQYGVLGSVVERARGAGASAARNVQVAGSGYQHLPSIVILSSSHEDNPLAC